GRVRMPVLLSADGGVDAAKGTQSMDVSQDLVDRVDRTLGSPVAARGGEQAVEERVLWVRGLEPRRGPEVVGRGVDCLPPSDRRDHVRRSMTQPERPHVDE